MTTTITGAIAHHPDLFLVYDWERESGNVEHDLVGTPNVAVTVRGSGPRRGTFQALFASAAAAVAFDTELATVRAAGYVLVDTDRTQLNMTFVLPARGRQKVALDPRTRNTWTVTFDFLEI